MGSGLLRRRLFSILGNDSNTMRILANIDISLYDINYETEYVEVGSYVQPGLGKDLFLITESGHYVGSSFNIRDSNDSNSDTFEYDFRLENGIVYGKGYEYNSSQYYEARISLIVIECEIAE